MTTAAGSSGHRSIATDRRPLRCRGSAGGHRPNLLARYRLACARYLRGDHAWAVEECVRIVAADPRNEWGHGYLGQGDELLARRDRAIATRERGLDANPENAVLHDVLGVASVKGEAEEDASHFAAAYRSRILHAHVTGKRR